MSSSLFRETDHATVLTFDEEATITSNDIRIDVLPVWKWMIKSSTE